jgi:hypothetical protein
MKTLARLGNQFIGGLIIGIAVLVTGSTQAAGTKGDGPGDNPQGSNSDPGHRGENALAGPLHTAGRQIYDARGEPVRLMGLNDASLVPAHWKVPPAKICSDTKSWGFNTVRLLIVWQNLEPTAPTKQGNSLTHHWNSSYVDAIKTMVSGYTSLGIGVILSPHQQHFWSDLGWRANANGNSQVQPRGQGFPHWMYPNYASITMDQARCDFFRNVPVPAGVPGTYWGNLAAEEAYLAGVFRDNPLVVGIDVFNEPYAYTCIPEEQNLDGLYVVLGSAIRAVNT